MLKGVRTLAVVLSDSGKSIAICALTAPRDLETPRAPKRFSDIALFGTLHHIPQTQEWKPLLKPSNPG